MALSDRHGSISVVDKASRRQVPLLLMGGSAHHGLSYPYRGLRDDAPLAETGDQRLGQRGRVRSPDGVLRGDAEPLVETDRSGGPRIAE